MNFHVILAITYSNFVAFSDTVVVNALYKDLHKMAANPDSRYYFNKFTFSSSASVHLS